MRPRSTAASLAQAGRDWPIQLLKLLVEYFVRLCSQIESGHLVGLDCLGLGRILVLKAFRVLNEHVMRQVEHQHVVVFHDALQDTNVCILAHLVPTEI